jgi:hypothetical protein
MPRYRASLFLALFALLAPTSPLRAGEDVGLSDLFTLELRRHWAAEVAGFSNTFVLDLREISAVLGPTREPLPVRPWLAHPYPNPFNGTAVLEYLVPAGRGGNERVTVAIHAIDGRLVRILVDERMPTGHYRASWNGRDGLGRRLASGVYVAVMSAGEFRMARKAVLLQ